MTPRSDFETKEGSEVNKRGPMRPWRKHDSQRPLFGGDFLGQILAADSLPGAFVHSRKALLSHLFCSKTHFGSLWVRPRKSLVSHLLVTSLVTLNFSGQRARRRSHDHNTSEMQKQPWRKLSRRLSRGHRGALSDPLSRNLRQYSCYTPL